MFRNYIKIASRNLWKNKLISVINILSLAIGISAVAVIYLSVQHELSFDKHALHKERVFRVVWSDIEDRDFNIPGVESPLIEIVEDEITGIEKVIPLFEWYDFEVHILNKEGNENTFYKEEGVVLTNSNYFSIYPHHWLSGNPESLNTPNKIVLSERDLKLFFPDSDAEEVLGKTIIYEDEISFEVRGVVEEMAENSDFKFTSFISFNSIPVNLQLKDEFGWDQWGQLSGDRQGLLLLNKGKNPKEIESELARLVAKHSTVKNNNDSEYALQALSDVHFNLDYNEKAMDVKTIRNLILLAVFLLLLGMVNFINLSTAQSVERAKEIGIRKTLGSSKAELRWQFLIETFLITVLAALLALLLLPLFLEVFKDFVPGELGDYKAYSSQILLFLAIFIPIVTLLAGFYPAWVLTGYAPISIMKNQLHQNTHLSRTSVLRQGLTVFQFVIASVFLICVWVVIQQTHFVLNRDIGVRKDAIVHFYIPGYYKNPEKTKVLKNQIASFPEIEAVSLSSLPPLTEGYNKVQVRLDNPRQKDLEIVDFDYREGDLEYAEVYQFQLVSGRNIRELDSIQEVWISEKAVEYLGFENPEEVLGQTFNNGRRTIVGVLKNFDISSAHESLRPFMYVGSDKGFMLHIALDKKHPETWSKALDKVSNAFSEIFPNATFDYSFYDKEIEKLYNTERQLSKLLQWAMGFSILIAGMGLFGLAVFTTNQRRKEIGIRKTLGASTGQIIYMLLKNLSKLVLMACVIAFPIAWYFMNKWLQNFVYRIEISPVVFLASTFVLLLIATLVLFSRGWYIASANPVNSLRDE